MKNHITLLILIALLILVATVTGVFYQTPGAPIEYVTVRGEQAVFQGSGLYRYDPAAFALEGVIWDVINLFIGLPLFALAIYLSQRNSLRGRLLLAGLLFYFFYVYLMATVGVAFNGLFLVYVAIFALSAVSFFLNLSKIDVARLPAQVSTGFPRRLFIGFVFTLSAVLIVLWVGRILPIMMTSQFPPEMAGMTTLVSQGIDLGIVVPLALSAGILLGRRSPLGYLLAGITLTHGLMMFISIPAWIVVPLILKGTTNLFEAAPFSVLSLIGLVLAGSFYRNVRETSQ
jgi:hypothetical protein